MAAPSWYRPWLHSFEATLVRYALPFAFGPKHFTDSAEVHVGSCVGVDLGAVQFLVTADHVIAEAVNVVAAPPFECMAGPVDLVLEPERLSRSAKADLATIRLRPEEVRAIEQAENLIVRPSTWPPPEPAPDDLIVFAGFPRRAQTITSWYDGVLNRVSEQALVVALLNDGFSYGAERADVRQFDVASGSEEPLIDDIGGMSGGPVFRVRLDPIVVPEFCGVVKEGGTPFGVRRAVVFSRLHYIRSDGTVV